LPNSPAATGLGSGKTKAGFTTANPLIRRLEEYTDLSLPTRQALEQLSRLPTRTIEAKRDLIRQGEMPRYVYLILKGWACRYKMLDDGRRQILDFPIPGDLCDLNVYILSRLDHSIGAITALEVIEIGSGEFDAITGQQPEIMRALWWQELVSKSHHLEWIVNVGARTALERVAHLLCEMFLRLESVGETQGYSCHFPLTQQDIADATGLTAVHVNRTLQDLRRRELIRLEQRTLTVPDLRALMDLAQYNPDYLHLRRLDRHSSFKR
jgi:CRP-like cAMP-binding protein